MKKNLKWIICSIMFIVFIILGILILEGNDIFLDSFVYGFISKYITNNLTTMVKYLTYLGSALVVILSTLLVLIIFKDKKYFKYISLNLILITLFQLVLKNIFSRERPIDINLIEETGYSFPSGHSLTAFAFYGFIIYLINISKLSKRSKIIYTVFFSLIILIVGISRIYLGVHYFTDVIGAYTFSLAYLIIYTSLVKNKLIEYR